jgi:hypothetical protein
MYQEEVTKRREAKRGKDKQKMQQQRLSNALEYRPACPERVP